LADRKRVLITGAAGRIGTALRSHLQDRYDFRLLLNSTIPADLSADEQISVGDISDFEQMVEVTKGVDAIVHLAIFRRRQHRTRAEEAKLTFDVDMKGTYNIFEAARINGVECVVFASTNHVTGLNEQDGILSKAYEPVRPDGVYGAGKAFGEALGRYYADRHGIRVHCLRIANFNGLDEPGRHYEKGHSRWLSPRDMAQLTWRSIEAVDVPFGIFYGVSNGGEEKWDLSTSREVLGFDPHDNGSLPEFQAMYEKRTR
jgi:uronate dehydrogenase